MPYLSAKGHEELNIHVVGCSGSKHDVMAACTKLPELVLIRWL